MHEAQIPTLAGYSDDHRLDITYKSDAISAQAEISLTRVDADAQCSQLKILLSML